MTRGNQRDKDRERAQARAVKSVATSQIEANQRAMSIICTICRQAFMCTQKKAQLELHVSTKHEKSTFDQCFPNFTGKA